MKLKLLYLCFSFTTGIMAQAQSPIWNRISNTQLPADKVLVRTSMPDEYQLFSLKLPLLKQQLQSAPSRSQGGVSTVIVAMPNGKGELKNFAIYKAPALQGSAAALHADIQTYAGRGVDNPSETIRFSITRYGLHSMMFANGETFYIDPYTINLSNYIVYSKKSITSTRSFYCGFDEVNVSSASRTFGPAGQSARASDGVLRTYRLAMACTVEYAAFHINAAGLNNATLAQKKAAVLAAMVVTMTRVNGIYERDLGITMEFVPNNEDVIFVDSDNLDNNNTNNALLGQSQETIDAIIGFNSYDIGHTVSTGGGGVAALQSPCSGNKATGLTGLPSPVGDSFDVDYVAHEMGHQFGGNHSYNNSCGGNRNDFTAYEPGSGSTIMAYAGICAPNVQNNSDAHFHAKNIEEMTLFITTDGNCGENTVTGNLPPVVNAGADYTIPFGTAFVLEGNATDANNDALTYSWEQTDTEISVQPPVSTSTEGPNFRSVAPLSVPQRYMPRIEDVVNNNLYPEWEVISNVARQFNFAFTVRDNNILGGQVVTDDMVVNVSGNAGPFVITAPNSATTWQAGTNQTVTWNVAGTTANAINATYVDILLSTDGGFTYPVILGAKVPNDGSEIVTVPNMSGSNNRIMVKGYEHIFYDISNTNFTITAPAATMAFAASGAQNITACKGNDVVYTLAYNAYGGFTGTSTFTATGIPSGSTIAFNAATVSATGAVNATISNTAGSPAGFYTILVTATSGNITKTFNLYLDLLEANFGTVTPLTPLNNAVAVNAQTVFEWDEADNAEFYLLEIATDENFTNIILQQNVEGDTYTATLAQAMQYYWRVSPANQGCVSTSGSVLSFITGITECIGFESADVPVQISDNENVTVTSTLSVTSDAPIQKVSVSLNIQHTWVGDLTATLTSPQGTEVQLFSEECEDRDDMNVLFDDLGVPSTCGSNPALSGILLPDEVLSAFNGESPEGEWTLTVSDGFGEDGGAINAWGITLCTVQEAILSADDNSIASNDFTVYPNPNSGEFTVQLSTALSETFTLSVYDMRGRQVYRQNYTNGGEFEQNINLQNAQAGLYVVILQYGNSLITKKIVVN